MCMHGALCPNHFHWMVYVRESELEIPTSRGAITGKTEIDSVTSNRESCRGAIAGRTEIDRVTLNREVSRGAIAGRTKIDRVTQSHPVNGSITKRNLNDSIAILLRSYTRAINVEQVGVVHYSVKKPKPTVLQPTGGVAFVLQSRIWHFNLYSRPRQGLSSDLF